MRALRTLLLAAVCTVAAACDSGGDSDGLTAAYFVGDWTLVAVADGTGDRTTEVDAVLDDLSLDFESNGDFAMAVDYSAVVNGAGTPDTTFAGTYGVSSGSTGGVAASGWAAASGWTGATSSGVRSASSLGRRKLPMKRSPSAGPSGRSETSSSEK